MRSVWKEIEIDAKSLWIDPIVQIQMEQKTAFKRKDRGEGIHLWRMERVWCHQGPVIKKILHSYSGNNSTFCYARNQSLKEFYSAIYVV